MANYVDYMAINIWGGNWDWPNKNYWAGRDRSAESTGFKFYNWDFENTMGNNRSRSPLTMVAPRNTDGAGQPHRYLVQNAEYRMLFADRLHRLLLNGGVLTPDSLIARYAELADQVERAIVAESARWGDQHHSPPLTLQQWYTERNWILNTYLPQRSGIVLQQFRNSGLYPNVSAPAFYVDGAYQHGGFVASGGRLTMPAAAGTVYYTLDGSDPRQFGGGISPSAELFDGNPALLSGSMVVKARALVGGEWSALNEAEFFVGQMASADNLAISELNYAPYPPTAEEAAAGLTDSEQFEFVELQNVGEESLDLAGVRFAGGVAFTFAAAPLMLDPGGRVVVVRDQSAFAARYDTGAIRVAGQYDGRLRNEGEEIWLQDRFGGTIERFSYDDGGDWPGRAAGKGASLELIDPQAVPPAEPDRTAYLQDGNHWRSSSEYGGSPGAGGEGPRGDVLVNEVLTHTDWPQIDTIELINTTGSPIDVGGWYLSDSWGWGENDGRSNYRKHRIPDDTVIPPGGYAVFDEDDFNPTPLDPGPNDFALDGAHGDDVWLMEADASGRLTRFVDHVEFPAAANGETFGRWPDGAGPLYPMTTPTLNPAQGENSGPRVGPLVLSELGYNPGAFPGADELEFVEIFNPTGTAVDLTDWRVRGGIDYDFPDGTLLGAGAALVVVPFDPGDADKAAGFRAEYGIDGSAMLLGAYSGRLDDDGETVRLQRPDEPPPDEPEFIPHLLEDELPYDDQAPWPGEADGGSFSLNRLGADSWGHDAASWTAAAPTPGTAPLLASAGIVGRHVFYNGSTFDGNSPAAHSQDDAAVATDKQPLLPGQTATFANYTSFSRGINGVMVDLVGLPQAAAPGTDDFVFRVGNSNDPGTWGLATAPTAITVRPGAGTGGSDRVTLIWPDFAVVNQWLEVTVLPTPDTGLAEADVFYFGNAIGEAGNSTVDAKVNASDMLLSRNNPRTFLNPAPIDFPCDFNRDARVNATDMLIARNNPTHFLNALRLIAVPDKAAEGPSESKTKSKAVDREENKTVGRDRPADDQTWIFEVAEIGRARRPSAKDNSTYVAIDELLAAEAY
ncbi:MAG: lamin tail domain-containing protein [Pirellulales bacterium]|nr:lamin tail domain-containing protein [Pirellulales bacterium]